MNQLKNGGPAFPIRDQAAHGIASAAVEGISDVAESDRVYTAARFQAQQGISARDYFAAHAPITLAEAKNQWHAMNGSGSRQPKFGDLTDLLAVMRGEYADSMIAERSA